MTRILTTIDTWALDYIGRPVVWFVKTTYTAIMAVAGLIDRWIVRPVEYLLETGYDQAARILTRVTGRDHA